MAEAEPLKVTVNRRLVAEGRWYGPGGAESERDRLMKEYRAAGITREEAQERVYPILDRMFPPIEDPQAEDEDAPDFVGFIGDVDDLVDPAYAEPDAGRRLRDSYIWVGDEFRRITADLPDGKTRQDYRKAKTRPPTPMAVGLAEFYGQNAAKRGELYGRLAQFAEKQHQPAASTPEADSTFIDVIE